MTSIPGNSDLSRADDDGMAGPFLTEPALQTVPIKDLDSLRAIRPVVETLSPAGLAALMSLANGRLDDGDPRKLRSAEIKSLRRLATQAHALDASMLGHAVDRRLLGEDRADISPEAANTALWTDRLIRALEGIVRRFD